MGEGRYRYRGAAACVRSAGIGTWGPGQWGLHRGFEAALFADFIGTAHNIELSAGIAVATRCADDNIVLMRSVKGLDLPKRSSRESSARRG